MMRRNTVVAIRALTTLLVLSYSVTAATVFSTSLESCREQCISRNIAIPLSLGATSWTNTTLIDCNLDCHVESCRVGCQDLESFNTTCDTRCEPSANMRRAESCRQGCRAVADIFIHQIQYLLNRVSVEILHNALQGVRLNWSFEDVYASTLQEISAANIRWVAQSRGAGGCVMTTACTGEICAWNWTDIDTKAFKDSKMQFTVLVPFEECPEIQIRLAAIWRDIVVVSETVTHPLPLSSIDTVDSPGGSSTSSKLRIVLHSKLQLSANSYLLCWQGGESRARDFVAIAGETPPPRFRLRILTQSSAASNESEPLLESSTSSEDTTLKRVQREVLHVESTHTNCHLFRNLPRENCCRIEITEIIRRSEEPTRVDASMDAQKRKNPSLFVDIQLENVPDDDPGEAFIIFTNGQSLLLMENVNDYIVINEPTIIPFHIADEISITALASLSRSRLLVGLSDGSIFSLDLINYLKQVRHKRDNDDGKTTLGDDKKDNFAVVEDSPIGRNESSNGGEMSSSKNGEASQKSSSSALSSVPSVLSLFLGHSDDIKVDNAPDSRPHDEKEANTMKTLIGSEQARSDESGQEVGKTQREMADDHSERRQNNGGDHTQNDKDSKPVDAKRIRASDGVAVVQIAVDALQTRLYVVRERAGLARCANFDDCDTAPATLATTNLQNSIQNIAVDSWNGFLYYVTANGDVFVTPLFPADATGAYALTITRRLADLPPAWALDVDVREQKLIVVLRNGSLWSRDAVNERLADERAAYAPAADAYRTVTRIHYRDGRLFWISKSCGDSHPWDTCLYSEEFDNVRKTVHLNRYLYGGRVQEFAIMHNARRPAFLAAPSRVGLFVDGGEARLNWRPPKSLAFQAVGSAWRSYIYKYTLASLNGTASPAALIAADTTNLTDIFVAIIDSTGVDDSTKARKARVIYSATVSACSRDGIVCSALASAQSRALAAGSDPARRSQAVVVVGKAGDVSQGHFNALSVLGRELSADRIPLTPAAVTQLPFLAEAGAFAVAYDNSSGALYASSRSDISIFRVMENGIRYRFLDFIAVRQMAIVTSRATIFIATAYSVVAYRLTSAFDKVFYNCMSDECGEVVGMAVEDLGDGAVRLFYFLRTRNGDVELHRLAFGREDFDKKREKIAILQEFYPMRQAVVLDDRILFLTSDGQLGAFDVMSATWSFNLALRDAQILLRTDATLVDNRLQFKAVDYDSTSGELRWQMIAEHSTKGGHVLYKVELYRDNFGGDRFVEISAQPRFAIPRHVLTAWRSAQLFDVQIDALNAWTIASANRTALLAPAKPPAAPTRLRIYATQQKTVDGTRANIDLLWEEPAEWNGTPLAYSINCTWANRTQLTAVRVSARRARAYAFTVKSGRMSCAVAAVNEQGLVGPASDSVVIDGSDFRPLIRFFAIDSTDSLVVIQNWTLPSSDPNSKAGVIEPGGNIADRRRSRFSRRQAPNMVQYQAVAFIGNELYAVRKEADTLFIVLLDINDISNVIYKGALNGDFNGQIEAMTSDWVGNRLLMVSNHEFLQIPLDSLQQASTITPRRLFSLSSGAQEAKQLVFDPFINVAYLLTKNGSLFSINLNQNGSESNLALELDCLRSQTITSIVAQFTWNRAASPYVFALTWNGMISINTALLRYVGANGNVANNGDGETGAALRVKRLSTDEEEDFKRNGSIFKRDATAESVSNENMASDLSFGDASARKCTDLAVNWDMFGEKGLKAISSFTVADKLFIFFTSNELLIYDRQSNVVSPVSIANSPLRQILAVSQSSQPYPDRSCFALPSPNRLNFTVRGEGRTGALVEIGEILPMGSLYTNCPLISLPQTQYQIQFWRRGMDKVKVKNSYGRIVQIENGVLDKETDYDVIVLWFNRYTLSNNGIGSANTLPAASGIVLTPPVDVTRLGFRTGYGFPTAPVNVSACALTPDAVMLYWKPPHTLNAPFDEIRYRVTQLSSTLAPAPIGAKQLEAEGSNGSKDVYAASVSDIVACIRTPCRTLIPNLRPAVDYQFWITALHISRLNGQQDDPDAVSSEAAARTRDVPGILRVEDASSEALVLRWNWLNPQNAPAKITLQYRQSGVDVLWLDVRNSSFDPTSTASALRNITFGMLQSATTYDYRYVAEYTGEHAYDGSQYAYDEFFYQQPQQARTKAGSPTAPTDVKIAKNSDGWILQWAPPKSNGGEPILSYAVEFRPNKNADWEIAERGIPSTQLFWRIGRPWRQFSATNLKSKSDDGTLSTLMPNLDTANDTPKTTQSNNAGGATLRGDSAASDTARNSGDGRLANSIEDDDENETRFAESGVAYRVRAANSEGFGAYALADARAVGGPRVDNGDGDASQNDGVRGGASAGGEAGGKAGGDSAAMDAMAAGGDHAARYFTAIFLLALLLVAILIFGIAHHRKLVLKHKKDKVNRIINLETIASQIQLPYSAEHFPPEVENELRNLPLIPRSCVEAKRQLGRGSFGEVWEGLLTDVDAPPGVPKLKVAIKYLKQCNNDESRLKFLREAILMNNFDHPNIIKLLGVQRQVEPHFLVIELMEGGDLHTFLNESRPHDGLPSQLCLKELLSMMIDIGRGGAYLETFKHVHRDLAARNCLLSSKFPAQRITKIGDFGLARDIFSQDYYRIHGSDFLPLRWLAPESAVSGIFTTKSDVWAFGIVLWEIMSLGQQPYPGLTNFDVLTGLHEGRTPRRPAECPDEIFAIMSAAWTADPFKRPTFADLLFKLESLRGKPHLQSTDPFPSSHLGFESSQGSKSSMNQPMTNDSSTTTSWRSARGIYADDASPLGDGNISATATPSRQHANRGAKPRVDKNDFRQNNFFKGAANTTTRQNAYATFERPESKLSGTTMSTVIDNHIDNEYEQPIRFSFSNRPNSQLQRSHEGEITNRKYGGSLDSYTNPGFIADSDSTGHGQSPSKNHTVGYHR